MLLRYMERSNIIPEKKKKKSDEQLVKNYPQIFLLPIFGKIFEKIIFDKIYNFLFHERLSNSNQSGFRPSNFYIK